MIRLGASQILMTNRDVTRTLPMHNSRRQPTFLYTKGSNHGQHHHHRNALSQIPQLNTSRPPTANGGTSAIIIHDDSLQQSTFLPHSQPAIWSDLSDDTDSDSTLSSIPGLGHLNTRTDGTNDTSLVSSLIGGSGPLRQVISMETIDSFPFLPASRNLPDWEIYDDNQPNQAVIGSSSEMEDDDEVAEDSYQYEDDEDDTPVPDILAEALWSPNMILATPQPNQSSDNTQTTNTDVEPDPNPGLLLDTPPRATR